VALALTQILFVFATRQTTAANAIFLQYTAPIYVAIFGAWFLGERAKSYDWLTMEAIGVGFFLFFSDKLSPEGWWGNVYAVFSGLTLAWLLLFMRKQKDGSTAETVLLGNLIAALVGLPSLLNASPTVADWGGIIFLGIFQLGIPFIMMSVARWNQFICSTIECNCHYTDVERTDRNRRRHFGGACDQQSIGD
jgi:drug/metabolite transporter (DMT)-like permease